MINKQSLMLYYFSMIFDVYNLSGDFLLLKCFAYLAVSAGSTKTGLFII